MSLVAFLLVDRLLAIVKRRRAPRLS